LSQLACDITLEDTMAKYLTRRCIWLHVITLLLVSSFILAAWWQYGAARAGNGLSWAYTFEWPAFAVYAVYMWWKMIHDQRTGFDRLWVARQHAAADRFGTPLHQIPGWATDKALSKAVIAASLNAPDAPALSMGKTEAYVPPALGDGVSPEWSADEAERVYDDADVEVYDHPGSVIDAEVVAVKTQVDEELMAYNRYLAELNREDVPKHWGRRRHGAPEEGSAEGSAGEGSPAPAAAESVPQRALPTPDRHQR
jgi:hypothetical protein